MNKETKYNILNTAIMNLSLSRSEEELLSVIKQKLPSICQVDLIAFSDTPWDGTKHTYTYPFTHNNQGYFIHFHKTKMFSREERLLLKKVGKALEWSLISLQKEKQLEITKKQWEMAFDAISIPISLIDKENRILRTNKAFREQVKKSKIELLRQNSFKMFFGKPLSFSDQKKTQETSTINGVKKTFEITKEKLNHFTQQEMYLLVFRDISKRIKMEKEIALSAKTAEIDIISHSIAHELNNPVAGIKALLQTMDPQEKNKQSLKEMEKAIERCGQIVQKLLKTN